MSSSLGRNLVWVVVLIFGVAIATMILPEVSADFASSRDALFTFWTSFCIGLLGAGVYLSLLLMTEKNLPILNNSLIDNISIMALLYLLSGGFVAAITQTATGTLTTNSIQAVFMLGFGWQGAISGVAATGTRVELNEENMDLRARAEDDEERSNIALEGLQKENNELKNRLREALMELRNLKEGETE
jgi:hypothetical protein